MGVWTGDEHERYFPDTHVTLLRPRTTATDSKFLVEYLSHAPIQKALAVECFSGSTNQVELSRSALADLRVLLPPLPEQRKIASILSSVDDTIEGMTAVIDQIQVVKKSLMQELLTRGIPGRHTRFKKTEIGEIPEGWEVAELADVVCYGPRNGKSPQSSGKPPGVPTFSIAAIRDGEVDLIGNLKYAMVEEEEVREYFLEVGDILIVRGNANPDLLGRAGMVRHLPIRSIYPDILMRIRPSQRVLAGYLLLAWNSDLVHEQLVAKAKTTSGTYKVNNGDVGTILLPVPSVDEQRRIVGSLEAIDETRRNSDSERNALRSLKSALLSVLLTGEVRVTPDPEPVSA